jgi:hypothetical protein
LGCETTRSRRRTAAAASRKRPMVDLHLRRRRRCRTEASALRMGSTKASALDGCGSRAVQSERLTGITCGPTAMQRRACYRRRPPRRFRFRSRRRSHNHRSVSNSMRRLTIPLLLVVFPSAYPWQHRRNRQKRRRARCRWLLGSPELSGVAPPHCALLIRDPVPHRRQIRTDTAASGQPTTTERPVEIAGLGIRLDVAAGCPRARIRARAAACGSSPSVVGNRECRKGRVSPRGDRRSDRRACAPRDEPTSETSEASRVADGRFTVDRHGCEGLRERVRRVQ